MNRREYDLDALELADDDLADADSSSMFDKASTPRRWQTELRHRPRRSGNSRAKSGLHQRRRKQLGS
jgi:hypothetical protein